MPPSFTPCYFCAFQCVQMCVNMFIFLEWTLFFIPQSSEKLSFCLFLTPQLHERWLVQLGVALRFLLFIQVFRTKYSFSEAGSKQGLKAPIPALPFPYHLCSPVQPMRLAVWLLVHLDIHTSQLFWESYNI